MTKIWFSSDYHHSHKNIVKFTNRGLETTQENHDEWLREVHNSHVAKGDLIYLLGDLSFSKDVKEIVKFFKSLNGTKIVLKGNHDRREVLDVLLKENAISWWGDYKEIKIGDTTACLFHFPISSWHKQNYGSVMCCGHCHGSASHLPGKILDVGLDSSYIIRQTHAPFSAEDVLEYMQNRKIHITDQHREDKS